MYTRSGTYEFRHAVLFKIPCTGDSGTNRYLFKKVPRNGDILLGITMEPEVLDGVEECIFRCGSYEWTSIEEVSKEGMRYLTSGPRPLPLIGLGYHGVSIEIKMKENIELDGIYIYFQNLDTNERRQAAQCPMLVSTEPVYMSIGGYLLNEDEIEYYDKLYNDPKYKGSNSYMGYMNINWTLFHKDFDTYLNNK